MHFVFRKQKKNIIELNLHCVAYIAFYNRKVFLYRKGLSQLPVFIIHLVVYFSYVFTFYYAFDIFLTCHSMFPNELDCIVTCSDNK